MNPSPQLIRQSIISTLAYFDIFNYPLTIAELHRYLWKPPQAVTLTEVYSEIDRMDDIEIHQGLVCLRGRGATITSRTTAYLESERKYKKRLPYIRLLTYLPHVQAIFVVNSLAFQNVRPDSDIDLLIVARPGTIWSTRFFTTALAKLLRLRPRPGNTKDTLCLSFYVDGGTLNMHNLMSDALDIHEVYWLRHLFPIYDPQNIGKKIDTANDWIHEYLPNAKSVHLHPLRTISHSWLHSISQTLFGIFSYERFWKAVQLAILPAELKQLSGPVERSVVVLSDSLLKFHTHDPKPLWRKQWSETVQRYSRGYSR